MRVAQRSRHAAPQGGSVLTGRRQSRSAVPIVLGRASHVLDLLVLLAEAVKVIARREVCESEHRSKPQEKHEIGRE
jgi:hypothetical protein